MTRTIAVCNQKGGVGKTTVAVNLADVLAHRGQRVLLIDADPQANATAHVGLGEEPLPLTLYDVLDRPAQPDALEQAVHKAGDGWYGIEVVPASYYQASHEQDVTLGREAKLATALRGTGGLWDTVVIDCPPNLGLLTINALVAADLALLVTEPRAASVDGLALMLTICNQVREHYAPGLRTAGVLVNRYRERRTDSAEWVRGLREAYPGLVLDPYVYEREVVARSTTSALPLSRFTPGDPGAVQVHDQLTELATQLEEK